MPKRRPRNYQLAGSVTQVGYLDCLKEVTDSSSVYRNAFIFKIAGVHSSLEKSVIFFRKIHLSDKMLSLGDKVISHRPEKFMSIADLAPGTGPVVSEWLLTVLHYIFPVLYCTVMYCNVLYCTVLYCTVLYCTVLYCTVLYCTVLYCTVLYCTVLYCTVLYCTVLYCTVLYCTVLYCTVLYCTVLYCTVLYCTVLYCTVLYCTVLYCTVLYCTVLYLWM